MPNIAKQLPSEGTLGLPGHALVALRSLLGAFRALLGALGTLLETSWGSSKPLGRPLGKTPKKLPFLRSKLELEFTQFGSQIVKRIDMKKQLDF